MRDLSDVPLTELEKQVYGFDAKRRPDGSVIEQGIRWPCSSPEAAAEAAARSVSHDEPAPAVPAPSQPEPRTIDLRTVHACPEMKQ
jgi:hypothetical protein